MIEVLEQWIQANGVDAVMWCPLVDGRMHIQVDGRNGAKLEIAIGDLELGRRLVWIARASES